MSLGSKTRDARLETGYAGSSYQGALDDGLVDRPSGISVVSGSEQQTANMNPELSEDFEDRPPYLYSMVAGGVGGSTGDLLMHSLDTVKTRQQGDPHFPPKYTTLRSSFYTIFRQEGIRQGLYGGWVPAMLGSLPGTFLFFGVYESSKRHLVDYGVRPPIAFLTAGFLGDLAASFIYVPSEVLKTRLQLQGRYNNPHFVSGYNYKGSVDAVRTLIRQEGFAGLFYGYKATLFRDLPFSALQFTFWETFQLWAKRWKKNRDVGAPLEFLTGAAAGGLAGAITCPLDVVKTRLQTQVHHPAPISRSSGERLIKETGITSAAHTSPSSGSSATLETQKRAISTSSPSTHTPRRGAVSLQTSSVTSGLKIIYQQEGISGWFRGVGPRFVWTSVQSGCMLYLYQIILRQLEIRMPRDDL